MKKSKIEATVKKKSKNASLKLKKKKKTLPNVGEGSKIVKKEKISRKSRWEGTPTVDTDTKKATILSKTDTPVPAPMTEKEDVRDSPRLKSLLEDRKMAVEQLFTIISGKALDDLIPDYLRKRPIDQLKKLCLAEFEKMSIDEILDTISGKSHPLFKEQETQTDFKTSSKDAVADEKEDTNSEEFLDAINMEIRDAQNQAPPEVLEEVAKDLGIAGGDAELLELEMRARAIRSLLKLKSNEEFGSDSNLASDDHD